MSTPGKGSRAQIAQAFQGMAIQKTYAAWVAHGRGCTQCFESGTADDGGCPAGIALWSDYREARIDASGGAS